MKVMPSRKLARALVVAALALGGTGAYGTSAHAEPAPKSPPKSSGASPPASSSPSASPPLALPLPGAMGFVAAPEADAACPHGNCAGAGASSPSSPGSSPSGDVPAGAAPSPYPAGQAPPPPPWPSYGAGPGGQGPYGASPYAGSPYGTPPGPNGAYPAQPGYPYAAQPGYPYPPPGYAYPAQQPGYGYPAQPGYAYPPQPAQQGQPPGYPPQGAPPGNYGAPPPSPYGPPPGYPWKPTVETHAHTGLFLGLGLGVSHNSLSSSRINGSSAGVSSTGVAFNLALGGAIVRDVLLFGAVSLEAGSVKDLKGALLDSSRTGDSWTFSSVSVGAGLRYYLEPSNVFLQGVLTFPQVALNGSKNAVPSQAGGSTSATATTDTKLTVTKTGVGAEVRVGKEWWVSACWGIGVSGWLSGASLNPDTSDIASNNSGQTNANYTLWSGGLALSATYN